MTASAQHGFSNKIDSTKLLIHEWISGKWVEYDTIEKDSSELIRKMLIGTWIDSNYRLISVGKHRVELIIYKDSIIKIDKWRPSELHRIYDPVPMDSAFANKLKNEKSDTPYMSI